MIIIIDLPRATHLGNNNISKTDTNTEGLEDRDPQAGGSGSGSGCADVSPGSSGTSTTELYLLARTSAGPARNSGSRGERGGSGIMLTLRLLLRRVGLAAIPMRERPPGARVGRGPGFSWPPGGLSRSSSRRWRLSPNLTGRLDDECTTAGGSCGERCRRLGLAILLCDWPTLPRANGRLIGAELRARGSTAP